MKNYLRLDLESEKSVSPDAAMLYAVPFHFFFWKPRWTNFCVLTRAEIDIYYIS
jgi:hypothetical protein